MGFDQVADPVLRYSPGGRSSPDEALVQIPGLDGVSGFLQVGVRTVGARGQARPQSLPSLLPGGVISLPEDHDRRVVVAGEGGIASVVPELEAAEGGVTLDPVYEVEAKIPIGQRLVEGRGAGDQVGNGRELPVAVGLDDGQVVHVLEVWPEPGEFRAAGRISPHVEELGGTEQSHALGVADQSPHRECALFDADPAVVRDPLLHPARRLDAAVLPGIDACKGDAVTGAVDENRGGGGDGQLAHSEQPGRMDQPDTKVGRQDGQEGQHGEEVAHGLGEKAADEGEVDPHPQEEQSLATVSSPQTAGDSEAEEDRERPAHAQGPQVAPVVQVRDGVDIRQAPRGEEFAAGYLHRIAEVVDRTVLQ